MNKTLGYTLTAVCTAALFTVSGCADPSITPAQVTAVAGDTATLIADINADVVGKNLTTAQIQVVVTDTARLSTDVAALQAGNTATSVSTVLADVSTAIQDVGPFLPEIEALVSLAAPAPGVAAAPASAIQTKAVNDYARLRSDARAAGGR